MPERHVAGSGVNLRGSAATAAKGGNSWVNGR
jgi:hypothetical protein